MLFSYCDRLLSDSVICCSLKLTCLLSDSVILRIHCTYHVPLPSMTDHLLSKYNIVLIVIIIIIIENDREAIYLYSIAHTSLFVLMYFGEEVLQF